MHELWCETRWIYGSTASYRDAKLCMNCDDLPEHERTIDHEAEEKLKRREELQANAKVLANVLISTADQIYGREIKENLGIARGGTVRAKNAISDMGAVLRTLLVG